MADFEKHLSIGLNMIPGVVVILHHLMAFALTADQLVSEKEQGLLTRTYICGLPLYLSLICQLFSHFIVIVPQVSKGGHELLQYNFHSCTFNSGAFFK